jgi:hypothetical protein
VPINTFHFLEKGLQCLEDSFIQDIINRTLLDFYNSLILKNLSENDCCSIRYLNDQTGNDDKDLFGDLLMNNGNKRDFFRVNILMPVRWRRLNIVETDDAKKGRAGKLLTQNIFRRPIEEMPEEAPSPKKDDRIYSVIHMLNDKLDSLINMKFCDSESSSATDRVVEISASGLKFMTMENIDAGIFLKMNIIIPGVPYSQIELISETMRIQKLDIGYLIAANIACIDDVARDFLVRIIFGKHRADIRRTKIHQEAGNDGSNLKG